MEANVWQKSCCYLMSYDLGLMVILDHFPPIVVRKYWYFLMLCDYKTPYPSFPYPWVLDCIHSLPSPLHPQVHWTTASTSPLHLQVHHVLRSKGLKDVMCIIWFGNDWDCSVGNTPEVMIT